MHIVRFNRSDGGGTQAVSLPNSHDTERPRMALFGVAIGCVLLAWLARAALTSSVGPTAMPFVSFFSAVALAAWYGGWRPGVLALVLSVAAANWSFFEPINGWAVASFADIAAPSAFVLSCSFIIGAIEAMHRANAKARAELNARLTAESRLAAIVEHSGDAIFTKNLDGIVETWNSSAQQLFGYSAEEIVGKPVTTLFPTERLKEEDHILERLRSGNPVERFETVRVAKDGRHIPVAVSVSPLRDSTGNIVGASKVVQDITALAAARDALMREKELLATTLASIGDAVMVTDAEGVLTFMNDEAERLTGWKNAEAKGKPLPDVFCIVNEQTRAKVENPVEKVLRLRRVVGLANHTILIAKDGFEIPIDDSAAPIHHPDGTLLGVVLVFRDVAEQRKSQEALRRTAEELARSSRAKDEFLATLSHELRTPLTPVLMSATALESDTSLPSDAREQLRMMRRNIELEARLIDDLLDLTRISRGKLTLVPEAVDIHQLLDHTAEIVRSDGLGKQVRIAFEPGALRHYTTGDPARLQQVFWNLTKNAVKFTPGGGTVTVSTQDADEGKICITVRDTGIGIAADDLNRIFNAFEQVETLGQPRAGGLGLGLAISKAVVEMHGGEIYAESEGAGRGATFRVILATMDEPTPSNRAQTAPMQAPRQLHLLVVEDHEATRTVISRLLSRDGHQIVGASTMREALDLAVARSFDVLISDLGLPDGSGLDLMREIKQLKPMHGIALTGYGMEDDLKSSLDAGFTAHLVKPVNIEQLRQLLAQIP